jgi:NADH-quinone oxidoreductase subunit J
MVSPAVFGHFLFQNYWLPVEIASLLLLIGLVGTLHLGRQDRNLAETKPKEKLK